jgi:NitT/TauT family transport system substrate-binding protein
MGAPEARRRSARAGALALAAGLAIVAQGCGPSDTGSMRIALNWKPEPEFGGLYEAQRLGAFERRGIELEITGGPGAPVVQMVAAGQVELGVLGADEVVMARDRGTDLVAVFATYQTNPQGIMVHAARGLHSIAELFAAGGTLAAEPGLPYVRYLERKYPGSSLRIVPYSYSIAPFLADPQLAQQVFVTSEPIAARRLGADPQVFLIAETGYDPYAAVVVARRERLRREPVPIEAFVDALREGWRAYLRDPGPANRRMGALNPEMDAETFRQAAEVQKPLIETEATQRSGLGSMTRERWAELITQLHELDLVHGALDPDTCFVNPAPAPDAVP